MRVRISILVIITILSTSVYGIFFERDPILLFAEPPIYPKEALDKGISGVVNIKLLVEKNGRVSSVEIIDGPEMFHSATQNAVKARIYLPALAATANPTRKVLTDTIRFEVNERATFRTEKVGHEQLVKGKIKKVSANYGNNRPAEMILEDEDGNEITLSIYGNDVKRFSNMRRNYLKKTVYAVGLTWMDYVNKYRMHLAQPIQLNRDSMKIRQPKKFQRYHAIPHSVLEANGIPPHPKRVVKPEIHWTERVVGQNAAVVVAYYILKDGTTTGIRTIWGAHQHLRRAREAIAQSTYESGYLNDEAVVVQVISVVDFKAKSILKMTDKALGVLGHIK